MHVELRIEADSIEELAHILAPRPHTAPPDRVNRPVESEGRTKEIEPEETTAPTKKSRASRGKTSKGDTDAADPTAEEAKEPAAAEASPPASDEPVTFEDLRTAAEPLLQQGKAKDIQEMLLAKFNVKAFGALSQDQYPAALAELQDLAA